MAVVTILPPTRYSAVRNDLNAAVKPPTSCRSKATSVISPSRRRSSSVTRVSILSARRLTSPMSCSVDSGTLRQHDTSWR